MNASLLVPACFMALASSCVATRDLAISARAVEVEASPGPVVVRGSGLSRVELAEIRTCAASDREARHVLLDIRIGGDREVQVPRMIVVVGKQAVAHVGDLGEGGEESRFVVRVSLTETEAVLTVIEQKAGEVIGSGTETIPIEPASSGGTPD